MNKTLYIGFYDFPYLTTLYELDCNEMKILKYIYGYEGDEYSNIAYLLHGVVHKEIDMVSLPDGILNNYNKLIVCEDGTYKYFNIKENE